MAGGGKNSAVAGGMNLSTPTLANGTLGLPQTSQLSGLQQAYGGMSGNQNYQMFSPMWQQPIQQHLGNQPRQGSGLGNLIGMSGGTDPKAAMVGKLLGLL